MNAQITVTSTGAVKLADDLNVCILNTTSSQILPDETNAACIGDPYHYFSQIWGYNIKGYNTYSHWADLLSSDKRLKENFSDIENPLINLLKLKGWKYDYKPDSSDFFLSGNEKEKIEKLKKNRQGFVAQEVLDIFSNAVVYEQEEDLFYLDYNYFIPVIVEAMKEQQTKIEEQQTTIEKLSARVETLEGNTSNEKSATISSSDASLSSNIATLAQNIPNPFSSSTRIDIYLPTTTKAANLYIYNMQGAQVKSYTITNRGNTSVTIDGYTLEAGMYLYTLIADGKEVDTKKMILTK